MTIRRSRQKVMHYATLSSDLSKCGVNIARGGWTPNIDMVTCKRCSKALAATAVKVVDLMALLQKSLKKKS